MKNDRKIEFLFTAANIILATIAVVILVKGLAFIAQKIAVAAGWGEKATVQETKFNFDELDKIKGILVR